MKTKELYLDCTCSTEILRVSKFDDEDEVYMTVYQYSSQRFSFLERLRILFGGKNKTANLILSKESFDKLKIF